MDIRQVVVGYFLPRFRAIARVRRDLLYLTRRRLSVADRSGINRSSDRISGQSNCDQIEIKGYRFWGSK
jgi:hypothetical protein